MGVIVADAMDPRRTIRTLDLKELVDTNRIPPEHPLLQEIPAKSNYLIEFSLGWRGFQQRMVSRTPPRPSKTKLSYHIAVINLDPWCLVELTNEQHVGYDQLRQLSLNESTHLLPSIGHTPDTWPESCDTCCDPCNNSF